MLKKIGLSFLTLVLVMNMFFIGVISAEETAQVTTEATQTTETSTENTTEEAATDNTEATEEGTTETETTEEVEEEATDTETTEETDTTEETEPVAEAGITPDSVFYSFDRLLEQVQLLLTFGENAKIELLAKLADERLAEAEVMTDAEKAALAEQAINDFAATLKSVVENVEASTVNVTDEAKVEAAIASLEALRAGFQERFEALVASVDEVIEEAEEAEEGTEEPTEDTEETKEEEATEEEESEEAEGDEGPVHIKQAIIVVYNLPENTFDVLLNERGLNFGQAKMVAILMGKLQAKQAAEAPAEESEETEAPADEAITEETGEGEQTAALDSLIDQVLVLRTKGWGQVAKHLGLHPGQAIGHILKQAGVNVDEDEMTEEADEDDDEDEDEDEDDDDDDDDDDDRKDRKKKSGRPGEFGRRIAEKARGKGRGGK